MPVSKGLRIADCGFMSLFDRGRKIEIENCINPQSAIRNPHFGPLLAFG